ncbi:MAG TPA: thioredoxin domain-containing protein [Verrucomicrobiae bacterium]|nr:thioredoxin domain-containing protein [Verrucomicrobiae bacterium]
MNHLAHEKSPYLLQHAHNPVDWFPWGRAAFDQARAENKPIFLSVGYSTCHWCHVMERESFEDERVGKFLNDHFVSIKVDREERPDVDRIYMTFVQATTGGGGWPMSVFLTPDLKPFFGGTYFPPDNRYGRPGFLQVLQHIAELWRQKKNELVASAEDIHARLAAASQPPEEAGPQLNEATLKNAATFYKQAFDPRHGGFGGAPKFPQPAIPQLLLRCARRFHDPDAERMVLQTCDRMAAGGIHDQLAGGFARYSVDAEWLVPHFEKMLYDNAQLAQLYLDAFLVSGDARHAAVARDILDYVLRDLTHPDGGFYSAEDADSEGHEGKFYCWTREELSGLLSAEEFNVIAKYFGITADGNFVDHSHPQPLCGQNVLSVVNPDLPEADRPLFEAAREKMTAARSRRVRPHRDDKILASWNGLMLGAFARAGIVLDEPKYLAAAEKNFQFIRSKLWEENAGGVALYHRWRDGERDGVQLLEGYAFYLGGVIDLYEATLQPAPLAFAVRLGEAILAKFNDADAGGFWQSPVEATDLIVRNKSDYDGAEPSGTSVAALSLLKLGAITGRKEFSEAATKALGFHADRLQHFPQAMPVLLQALDFSLQEPRRVVIAGQPESTDFPALIRAAHSAYQPYRVILGNAGLVEEFARTLPARGEAMVYLCRGDSCQAPTADPAVVQRLLLE